MGTAQPASFSAVIVRESGRSSIPEVHHFV
jgi:hypothetical protein